MVRGLVIALSVVVVVWLLAVGVLLAIGRRQDARELARLVPNLMVLFRGLVRDPRVPRRTKAWVWFALAWVVFPIDVIPEFIPVLGPLDDAIVAALVLRYVMRTTEPEVLSEHWRGDPVLLDRMSGRS